MSLEAAQMKTLLRNLVRAFYFDQMMYRRITTGQLVGALNSRTVFLPWRVPLPGSAISARKIC
jgi:hypothetical protein